MTYAACSGTVAAIKFAGCSNCSVLGLTFANYPVAELAQFGWGVMVNGGTGNLVGECWAYDLGNHHFGSLGANGTPRASPSATASWPEATPRRRLGSAIRTRPTDLSRVTCTLGAGSEHPGIGAWTGMWFSSGATQPRRRRSPPTHRSWCTATATRARSLPRAGSFFVAAHLSTPRGPGRPSRRRKAPKPFAIDNATAVTNGNRWTPSAFPMLVDTCSVVDFIGEQKDVNTGHIYVRDTAYETTITPAAADAVYTGSFLGFGARGLLFAYATSKANNFFHTFDCCTFKAPMTGAICRMFSGGGTATGNEQDVLCQLLVLRLIGGTHQRRVGGLRHDRLPFFEFKGCMFSHSVKSGTSRVCLWDNSNPTVGNFTDCSYYNHDEYSHPARARIPPRPTGSRTWIPWGRWEPTCLAPSRTSPRP